MPRAKKSAPQPTPPPPSPAQAVAELRLLQRQRTVVIKSRIMQSNRLQAVVAGEECGYSAALPEKARREAFSGASRLVAAVRDCVAAGDHFGATLPQRPRTFDIIATTLVGIDAFDGHQARIEREMLRLAARLPVAPWVSAPERRGFGLLSLAVVVGECDDLSQYANPGKLWKRMGCAPHTHEGVTLMGSTWKAGREGRLPASEWEAFGYSPRRRSLAYVIGESLLKANGPSAGREGAPPRPAGPYHARYVQAKVRAYATHPEWDWKGCARCGGTGVAEGETCGTCGGTGRKCLRAHRHGMLLAVKLLLKDLWVEWRRLAGDLPAMPDWREQAAERDAARAAA